jgi:hypothetical protein
MIFFGILLFVLLRSPGKSFEPYDKPFWDFSNGGNKKTTRRRKQEKKNMQNSGLRLSDTVCTAPLGPIRDKSNGMEINNPQKLIDNLEKENQTKLIF